MKRLLLLSLLASCGESTAPHTPDVVLCTGPRDTVVIMIDGKPLLEEIWHCFPAR